MPASRLHTPSPSLPPIPTRDLSRWIAAILALACAALCGPAWASVTVHFQSFNGSVFFGRYPHTFVVMTGTLDATGKEINENYGFSAKHAGPAVLSGPVTHEIIVEKQKYVDSTNRHFSVTVPDQTYWRIKDEVEKWRNLPGKGYDLDTRNCIHFVGAIARIVGLAVTFPADLMRKPKAWLNLITMENPSLGAKQIG